MLIKINAPGEPNKKQGALNYKQYIQFAADATYNGEKLKGCLKAEIKAYYPYPKKSNFKDIRDMEECKIRPVNKVKTSNIASIVLDALEGKLYTYQGQVVELHVENFYDANARIEIKIGDVYE